MMAVDALLILAALWISVALVNEDFYAGNAPNDYLPYFLFAAACGVVTFHTSGLYRTIVLYMGVQSGLVMLKGVTIITAMTAGIVYLSSNLDFPVRAIPVFWMIALTLVGGIRFTQAVGNESHRRHVLPKNGLIKKTAAPRYCPAVLA